MNKVNAGLNNMLIKDKSELSEAALKLLSGFPGTRIFAFYGELGAGKTTFIRQICNKLKVSDTVTSPTFAIINIYRTETGDEVYHFDFYRIENITEIMDLGYEEYFESGNYCFLEWPEKIESVLPDEAQKVHIEVANDGYTRIIHFD